MGSLRYLFVDLWHSLLWVLKSKYKWFVIAFLVWLFRVEFIAGAGQTIQAVSFLVFAYFMFEYRNGIMWYTLNRTNAGVRNMFVFFLYAIALSAWSFLPAYSVTILFQNSIVLLAAVWLFTIPRSFRRTEHVFVLVGMSLVLFEAIALRLTWQSGLFTHHLASGSIAAMMLSYCVAELLNMPLRIRKTDIQRRNLLIGSIIVCVTVLITSTSSGANASALFGVSLAMFFSKKRGYGLLLMLFAGILFFNQDIIEELIFFIMPGKDLQSLSTASGRETLWNYEWDFIYQRPLFGWGFACIERAITEMTDLPAMDAHNSYLGIIGGMGYVGFLLFLVTIISVLYYTFTHLKTKGYHGIFCALCCALLNAYSFGFLSGKTSVITIMFLIFVALTAGYNIAHRYDVVYNSLKNRNLSVDNSV